VPRSALREALLNALLHRDYRMSSQVRILIFSDRTEFANPGGLLNRLTVDSIRAGMSQRRNPAICSLLNRARGAENIGRGIPEMIRAMKDRGLPEPEFDVQGGHFRVVLRGGRGAGT
jgi:ATP-dependent DNA helicase RecG